MKRLLSLFLIATMLLAVPMQITATPLSTVQEDEPYRTAEVRELRKSNSDSYLLSDGTYECVVYAYDKYYQDDFGSYVEIDNSIVKSPIARS